MARRDVESRTRVRALVPAPDTSHQLEDADGLTALWTIVRVR
jgi:hypothetical protein